MSMVQQAVLDFDEEVQAPWRPRLVAVPSDTVPIAARGLRAHPSGRSSSRVGICRPVEPASRPVVPVRREALSAGARRRPAPAPVGYRLTRRARRLATVLTLALGVAVGSWLGPLIAGGEGDLRLAGVQSVVVEPGDTLWSIATDAAGTGDVRAVVDRIQELNGLHDAVLVPGQVLELP